MKLADLAKKLEITQKDLRLKLKELGFEVKATAKTVDDDVAELVLAELKAANTTTKNGSEEINNKEDANLEGVSSEGLELETDVNTDDVADVYDELIHQQLEKEVVKSQRKKTAGKGDDKKKKPEDNVPQPEAVQTDAKGHKIVEILETISVKELAEKSGISVAKIIGELMKNGILANINQQIDFETVLIISDDLGIKVKQKHTLASADEILGRDITNLLKEEDETVLKIRPPVVVVMGHVDHGKTKLLDAIRSTNVVASESGGITQHIGAYQVEKKGRLITFLDTPGHEAFTEMRARGAKVTDIAILVVAADEGIKPQTIEAINHAKEAEVPIIVAINKMDKPTANPDLVKGQLSEHGLQPEDWGGKTICVPISALKGEGIDDILDMILLVADMENLKANPDRAAVGTVVEAHLDHSIGPVATVLVNTGTLRIGDCVVVGSSFGKVKAMFNSSGKKITEAPPSAPVRIAGLDKTPFSGDILQAMPDEKSARQKAECIGLMQKQAKESGGSSLSQLITTVKSDKMLKLIIKADTKGSLEAIKGSLAKIKDEDVALKIIHSSVGHINESDIMMASASKGFVIGFHSDFDSPHAKTTAENEHVEVRMYKIIYELLDDVKKLLSGLLEPDIVTVELGKAEVMQIFLTKKKEMIVGCKVKGGKITKDSKLRVVRKDEILTQDAQMVSLQRGVTPADDVSEGEECGIKYAGNLKVQPGDIFEAYRIEKRHRGLGEARV